LNKLLPLLAFSILLLVPAGVQSAFAQEPILPLGSPVDGECISNGMGGGDWSDPNTWDCVGVSDVPASRKQVQILFGDTVTVDRDLNRTSGDATTFIGRIAVFGTLVVPSPFTFKADTLNTVTAGTVENFGNMILAQFFNTNIFNNNCGSTLTIKQLSTNKDGSLGPVGQNFDPFTNYGAFELGILFGTSEHDPFLNAAPFQNGGSLINVIESGQDQNFAGTVPITTIPSICAVVGGEFLSVDSTALVLAGLQSSAIWMLPVLAGVAGSAFSILYIKSRRN